ncbi:acyl-homoserine-lactone synthase, partial [Vibrio parahaemolyticus]|uniref:acyl-homoserine-lactone synthase n=2 Tax=Vibrionaceae TaxID=641 RepID=UPI0017FDF50C
MSLEQSLEYLTKINLPIESKQQALVDSVILTLTKQKRDALFQQVALYRIKLLKSLFPKHASKSLSALFELMDYRDLVQQYPTGFSKEIRLLEQLAA